MSTALSLYRIEDDLAALLETKEGGVEPELEEEIQREIVKTHLAAVEKRDNVSRFLAHLELQQSNIDSEIKRLQALKKSYAGAQERVEGYVVRVIKDLGPDAKGKFRKLEGNSSVLSLRACPSSVEITDEFRIPVGFRSVSLTLPWEIWLRFVGNLNTAEFDLTKQTKVEVTTSKSAVKDALTVGEEVPGARLVTDKYNLQRK